MVKIMENPITMDDLGGRTTIFGNIHVIYGKFPYIELICMKPVRHTIPMDLLWGNWAAQLLFFWEDGQVSTTFSM